MDHSTFAHLEIHGSREPCLAFIEGFRLAAGKQQVFFSDEIGFELPSFLDSLASGLHRETHLAAPLIFLNELAEAMRASTRVDLRPEEPRQLSGAQLSFEYKCFSAADGKAIRKLIEEDLPETLVLDDYDFDEIIDADAKGPELYAPLHDYVLKGRGIYRGSFKVVATMARRLADQDFVHPGKIELAYL